MQSSFRNKGEAFHPPTEMFEGGVSGISEEKLAKLAKRTSPEVV